MNPNAHRPVLLAEMVEAMNPAAGKLYVDGTFGAGGYATALLGAAACRVIGIDRDPLAVANGRRLAPSFGGRLAILEGRFGEMDRLLDAEGVDQVDGVALDVGVSSMQLDEAARGFSFSKDGPLDMRMAMSGSSAADIVNHADESELAEIIYNFGEERRARAVARAIVAARRLKPIARTTELAAIVARVVRGAPGHHPATRTFQALRLRVNDELGELSRGLSAAERILKPMGRLAVVTFHSLEDRLVKLFLTQRAGKRAVPSRHLPVSATTARPASLRPLFAGAKKPSAAEIAANPRARSARLRAAERTTAPAWPTGLLSAVAT